MGHCTWWTKRWWVPRQEVNKVTQQKKQNANTIERVLKICIVSPAPVGMTARKWHLQLHRTNQKKSCNQWDFPKILGFQQISINFLNSQGNFGTGGNCYCRLAKRFQGSAPWKTWRLAFWQSSWQTNGAIGSVKSYESLRLASENWRKTRPSDGKWFDNQVIITPHFGRGSFILFHDDSITLRYLPASDGSAYHGARTHGDPSVGDSYGHPKPPKAPQNEG